MANSQASILQLRERGFTDTQIGRLVGRDSSLIKQISTGKKPGANLADTLASFLAKPKADVQRVEVPRRLSKAGTVAEVRSGVRQIVPGMTDRVKITTKAGRTAQLKQLRKLPKDAKVFLTATVKSIQYSPDFVSGGTTADSKVSKDNEVDLFAKGGWNAGKLLERVEAAGGNGKALNAVILEQIQSLPFVESVQGIGRLEMRARL